MSPSQPEGSLLPDPSEHRAGTRLAPWTLDKNEIVTVSMVEFSVITYYLAATQFELPLRLVKYESNPDTNREVCLSLNIPRVPKGHRIPAQGNALGTLPAIPPRSEGTPHLPE